ncbi:BnaA10g06720D [Brassica napus]|uniref:BnaA10g06720D protein n=1 Tax=Brassica napus TaxID=3708 RepID=A0A078FPW4_BRANA|nr:BnaA10g06720D [Brassica napus]
MGYDRLGPSAKPNTRTSASTRFSTFREL